MSLGRVWNYRKFDAGMVAFLECLRQVGEHLHKHADHSGARNLSTRPGLSRTSSLATVLPYKILDDKIGPFKSPDEMVSIKLGVGLQGEDFTKACKYALTCCKFLLAYVSNLDNPKP